MPPKICAFVVVLLIGFGVASGTRTEDCRATCPQTCAKTCEKTCDEKEGKKLVVPGFKWPKGFKSWAEAREACKKKGGDLAMKLTEKDIKYVYGSLWSKNFLHAASAQSELWVGGLRNENATELNWMDSNEWLDGTPIPRDYDLWEKDYPLQYRWLKEPWCLYLVPNRIRKGSGKRGPAYRLSYCERTPYMSVTKAALCEIPN